MTDETRTNATAPVLESLGGGIWVATGARIIDRTGRKMLPIGRDGFVPAAEGSVVIDKTMLMADVLDSGYTVTLFCRPRRFGKTLNMSMMKAFFEAPGVYDKAPDDLFDGTEIHEACGGRYREFHSAYPVAYINFNTVKKASWSAAYEAIKGIIVREYDRHGYLAHSDRLSDLQKGLYERILHGQASEAEYETSLEELCRMLSQHHGERAVLLVDEYDAPVMAGYSAASGGYYREVVEFLKAWLTGALKGGGDFLAFSCLTGVQRISKESIFSDLNNIAVSTALSSDFDERYGFTGDEVAALATYLGHADCIDEAREWYDGYRFGTVDIYNPWSVLNYLKQDCTPGVYWLNTSSNSVVGASIRVASDLVLRQLYGLVRPGGAVVEPLDLGVVFPDVGVRADAMWSMLYLAGYLTTNDVAAPDDPWRERRLRIPNREIRRLFEKEIPQRFAPAGQGPSVVRDFQRGLRNADAQAVRTALGQVLLGSASSFDLRNENSYHMILLGLCFGIEGYESPTSNREAGRGRYDISVKPEHLLGAEMFIGPRPLITIEVKHLAATEASNGDALQERLAALAGTALAQISDKGYDALAASNEPDGRVRWGIAFSGKHVSVACERA